MMLISRSLMNTKLLPSSRSVIRAHATAAMATIGVPLKTSSRIIYLDYNGTTPIYPEVSQALTPFLTEHYGNASSGHALGTQSRQAVERARGQVASLINSGPDELYFTSCGTESDNWAIWGAISAARAKAKGSLPHVVTSSIEHPAILNQLKHLESLSLATYTIIPVSSEGLVDEKDVIAAMIPGSTCLVSIMHSNNETGAIQPIARILREVKAKDKSVIFHTDAAQSFGKGINVDMRELGVDLATVVGHKFGAPKGVAALYVKRGVTIAPLFLGGGQESGHRAGTESPLVIGLGAAAALALKERKELGAHLLKLRDTMEKMLLESFPEGQARVNGPKESRLPNTLSISIKGLQSSVLLHSLRDKLAASAGAACHSKADGQISSVLKAMNVPREFAVGTLRLSVGRHSTLSDVLGAVDLILDESERQGIATNKKGSHGSNVRVSLKTDQEIEWERNLF